LALDVLESVVRQAPPGDACQKRCNELCNAVRAASRALFDEGRRDDPHRTRTAVALTAIRIAMPYVVLAHAGDSRLYYARGQKLLELTRDARRFGRALAIGLEANAEVYPRILRLEPAESILLCGESFSDDEIARCLREAPVAGATQALECLRGET